jgi:hypothetical protein
MRPSEKLLDFFRGEFLKEESSGFARLSRVPDVRLRDLLANFKSLSRTDQLSYMDCGAHWAYGAHRAVVDAPEIDHMSHPYFKQWSHALGNYYNRTHYAYSQRSIPSLCATIQQYKIDIHRHGQSRISKEDFEHACSVNAKSVKAPELRKRIRAVLRPLGYYRMNKFGYCCRKDGREFLVRVSFGGARAPHQLAYGVVCPEFSPKQRFKFERALGIVTGRGWDFIVEENVDDALSLFSDLVEYSFMLPERIRAAAT